MTSAIADSVGVLDRVASERHDPARPPEHVPRDWLQLDLRASATPGGTDHQLSILLAEICKLLDERFELLGNRSGGGGGTR